MFQTTNQRQCWSTAISLCDISLSTDGICEDRKADRSLCGDLDLNTGKAASTLLRSNLHPPFHPGFHARSSFHLHFLEGCLLFSLTITYYDCTPCIHIFLYTFQVFDNFSTEKVYVGPMAASGSSACSWKSRLGVSASPRLGAGWGTCQTTYEVQVVWTFHQQTMVKHQPLTSNGSHENWHFRSKTGSVTSKKGLTSTSFGSLQCPQLGKQPVSTRTGIGPAPLGMQGTLAITWQKWRLFGDQSRLEDLGCPLGPREIMKNQQSNQSSGLKSCTVPFCSWIEPPSVSFWP